MPGFPTAPPGLFQNDGNKPVPHGYGVDSGSLLCPPLIWPLWEGAGSVAREVREGFEAAWSGNAEWGPGGILLSTTGTDGQVDIPYDARYAASGTWTKYTWEVLLRVDTTIADYTRVFNQGGYEGQVHIWYRSGTGRWYANVIMSGDNMLEQFVTFSAVAGGVYHIVVTVDAVADEGTIYANGIQGSVDTSVSGTVSFDTDAFECGERLDGTVMGIAMWPGIALTAEQVAERSRDFFAPLRPGQLWLPVAAAGITATPAPVTLTWSVPSPSVRKTTSPAAIAATWSVPTPTIQKTTSSAAIAATWSAPAVTTKKTASLAAVSATWSVPVPAMDVVATPSPLTATWSVPAVTCRKTTGVSPLGATWSVPAVGLRKTHMPSPVSAAWSAPTPTTSIDAGGIVPLLVQAGCYLSSL